MTNTKKGDFVEIEFTGKANEDIFDSNIPEDLKKINPKAEPKKTIIIIGEGMVVKGLDDTLKDKEIGKKYNIKFSYQEGFGKRHRELVRTIPLSIYTQHKINPQPGMPVMLDNNLAKVIAVSGARVTTDFNNPLAGKNLEYRFKIKRIVNEEKEKCETFFEFFLKHLPEFEIKEKVIVKGPEWLEALVNSVKDKFKELIHKDLTFELKKEEIKHSQ